MLPATTDDPRPLEAKFFLHFFDSFSFSIRQIPAIFERAHWTGKTKCPEIKQLVPRQITEGHMHHIMRHSNAHESGEDTQISHVYLARLVFPIYTVISFL
jgi:hypothetical protein